MLWKTLVTNGHLRAEKLRAVQPLFLLLSVLLVVLFGLVMVSVETIRFTQIEAALPAVKSIEPSIVNDSAAISAFLATVPGDTEPGEGSDSAANADLLLTILHESLRKSDVLDPDVPLTKMTPDEFWSLKWPGHPVYIEADGAYLVGVSTTDRSFVLVLFRKVSDDWLAFRVQRPWTRRAPNFTATEIAGAITLSKFPITASALFPEFTHSSRPAYEVNAIDRLWPVIKAWGAAGIKLLFWLLVILVILHFFLKTAKPKWHSSLWSYLAKVVAVIIVFALRILSFPFWWTANKLGLQGRPPIRNVLDAFAKFAVEPYEKISAEDKLDVALKIWPKEEFRFLYADNIPPDLARPLWEDGKLIGGVDPAFSADRHITAGRLRDASNKGALLGLSVLLIATVALLISIGFSVLSVQSIFLEAQSERTVIEQWSEFTENAADDVRAPLAAYESLGGVKGAWNAGLAVLYFVASIPFSFGIALFGFLLVLNHHYHIYSQPYAIRTKDADVRWPFRAESRQIVNNAYQESIDFARAYLGNTKTFSVGRATGTFRLRGDLAAPLEQDDMCLDWDSLSQHVMVFGGTGEGKTAGVLRPLLTQVLSKRGRSGRPYGAYVTDAKGVLWQDVLSVCSEIKREKDVVVIGLGDKQYGVDVFSDLSPTDISTVLRSVMSQDSRASDTFWPDMAASIIRHALTIGRAYSRTDAAIKEYEAGIAGKRVNAYSLWWAYQAILKPAKLEDAIDAVLSVDSKASPDEFDRVVTLDLIASADYIRSEWKAMADRTRSGVVAHVSQLLDGFSSAVALRQRFATGEKEGAISTREAFEGKVILNALSNVEHGLPARLVSILIKSVLYRQARIREIEMKQRGESPQSKPCVVVMDEAQELVTVDSQSGISDGSFWNVARSTGLSGIFATQTVAALRQSMGEEAADNFMQQARSKIFLRTEEKATFEYACQLAGTAERNRVFDDDQYESIEHRMLLDRWEPLPNVDDAGGEDPGVRRRFGEWISSLLAANSFGIGRVPRREIYAADYRAEEFLDDVRLPIDYDQREMRRADIRKETIWRAEDKEERYRSQGNSEENLLRVRDLTSMGRWHAYAHLQRAGVARQDIIRLQHLFGTVEKSA